MRTPASHLPNQCSAGCCAPSPHDAQAGSLSGDQDDPLEPLYTLAMTTGMRLKGAPLGVALAGRCDGTDLRGPGHPDADRGRVRASHRARRPRADAGSRLFSSTASAALRGAEGSNWPEARLRAGEAWADHGLLVFTVRSGNRCSWSPDYRAAAPSGAPEGQLPLIHFHDLRHTSRDRLILSASHPRRWCQRCSGTTALPSLWTAWYRIPDSNR